jgi:hypothetical protein
MGLYEIKDINELLKFLPGLVQLFDEKKIDGMWKEVLSKDEFVADLTNYFKSLRFFGLLDEKGQIKYFFAISETESIGSVWIFYVGYSFRDQTKLLFSLLKGQLKQSGLTEFRFYTRKLTSSYDRWISKLGAERFQVTYQIKL